ncbi:MAG: hypothetical protein LBM09_00555 [Candidatus Nomurabacteria bacterium]|jgi:hypothetical protein|nr:hypothetical protein [Candidatus Nomurabacteria bacterium]
MNYNIDNVNKEREIYIPNEQTESVICCREGLHRSPTIARGVNEKKMAQKCIALSGGLLGVTSYLQPAEEILGDTITERRNMAESTIDRVCEETNNIKVRDYYKSIFDNDKIDHIYLIQNGRELRKFYNQSAIAVFERYARMSKKIFEVIALEDIIRKFDIPEVRKNLSYLNF